MRALVASLGASALVAASCFDWAALSPAKTALQLRGGCAVLGAPAGHPISLTGADFTVAFWLRVDDATGGPVVWQGGTTDGEPGWSFSVGGEANALTLSFCIANAGATDNRCVTGPIVQGDAVHVVVTSTASDGSNSRDVKLFELDATAGQTTHTLVGTDGSSFNNWTTNLPFTLGGAWTDAGCERPSHVTLRDLRIAPTALDQAALDGTASEDAGCTGLTAGFRLDEGEGGVASDCSQSEPPFTLVQPFDWVASPFP